MTVTPLVAPARVRAGFVARVAVFTAVQFLAVWVNPSLTPHGGPQLWVASGTGLAGLLLLGARAWPAVFIGAILGNLANGPGPWLGLSVVVTLEALVPVLILRGLHWNDPGFEHLGDVVRYICIATVVGPLLSAGGAYLVSLPYGPVVFEFTTSWFLGSLNAVMLLTPCLLTWAAPRPSMPRLAGVMELAGMVAVLGLTALLGRQSVPVYLLPAFPLVAWSALRAGPRGITLVSLGIYLITWWAVSIGQGPVPDLHETERMFFLVGVNVTQAATGLLLAASAADRRRARLVERAVEDAYRALIAASPFAVTGLDREGRVTVWSHAAERIFGWSAAEVLGRPLPNVPAERQEEFNRQLTRQAEAVSDFETVRRRKDGTELEVSLTTWPLYDDSGRLIGVMGAQQDITERKRSERLQRATYRISQAALAAPDLNQLFTAIHAIVSELMPARNLYLALYDPTSDTISFPYWVDELDPRPEPRRARKGLTEYVIRTGRPLRDRPAFIGSLVAREEVESFGSDSTDWLGVPLKVGGRAFGVLAVQSYDPGVRYSEREEAILEFVSSQVAMAVDRKQAEAALRQSEERFRVVASTTNDALWEWDTRRQRAWMSGSVQQILGYTPGEFRAGRADAWEALVHPQDHERVVEGLRDAVAGTAASWRAEYRIRRRDGSHAYVFDRARILRDDRAGTVRVLGAMMDVSDRREAEEALRRSEEQLRQAMKMEAVGRLAGGVAHDFNNLLTSVLGHADLALAALGLSDPLREDLLEIRSAGTRAAALTQQLLAFSRKQVLEPRIVDLNGVVSGLARMLRRTIGEDIELVTLLAPDLHPVRADPVQMEQVFLNLAVNARDAMPDGGRLTIHTRNVLLPAGPAARVTVEDTGLGMTEEVRAHLFEPFFTTKAIGKGTGLGLATVYGIVQQSGGSIVVTSTPGQGTTFVVDLPYATGDPVSTERDPPVLQGGGSETVLLVEDEEGVRQLTRRVLELHGYRVLVAADGDTALAVAREHAGEIDLLLTDVVMPGMSGPRLAEALAAEGHELRVVLMSGYAASALEERVLLRQDTAFLQKPFTTEQLARRLREVLDDSRREPRRG